MRSVRPVMVACVFAWCALEISAAEPVALWLRVGVNDRVPSVWQGEVTVDEGRLVALHGWRFEHGDRATGGRFVCRTRRRGPAQRGPVQANGLFMVVEGGPTATVRIQTNRGTLAVPLRDLDYGRAWTAADGNLYLVRVPLSWQLPARSVAAEPEDPPLLPGLHVVPPLMDPRYDGSSQEDYPAIAVTEQGSVWVAWNSYFDGRVEVRVAKFDGTHWSDPIAVSEPGDVVGTALAAVGEKLWCVWSEQRDGNFDLYGAFYDGQKWAKPVRLSRSEGQDVFARAATISDQMAVVSWMGTAGGKSRIMAMKLMADGSAGDPMEVDDTPVNQWFPSVCADGSGGAWIVYDLYASGSYDVRLAHWSADGRLKRYDVAATPLFEANASVATGPDGAVAVAWEESGPNWGKDFGQLGPKQGTTGLYPSRKLRVALFKAGQWYEPNEGPETALPPRWREFLGQPHLAFDARGRLWLVFQKRHLKYHYPWQRGVWELFFTVLTDRGWRPAGLIPASGAGPGARPAVLLKGPNLWLAWFTDGRPWRRPIIMQRRVRTASIDWRQAPGDTPKWVRRKPRQVSTPVVIHPTEQADVARMRQARWQIGDTTLAVYRGDLHRHTDWSWDGAGDGSLLDMYRYALDAADLDFIASTEHVGWGSADRGNQRYAWWRNEQFCDVFYRPGYFLPLYAYERSMHYPFGHRNIIQPRRGIPPVMAFLDPLGRILPDDTQRLYQALKKTGSLAMAHTTATGMGTDWSAYDPEVEPLVEIYQGCRLSYEMVGAPRAAKQPGQFAPGFVVRALAKGYRLGFQSSSDHRSTHMSYTCLYAADFSREGLMNAMRQRLSYGATDNILVKFYALAGNEVRPLGAEVPRAGLVRLGVHVVGTAPIERIAVVRNGTVVYAWKGNGPEAEFTYEDMAPPDGRLYYYVRVEQKDGQLAWASPIWIVPQENK